MCFMMPNRNLCKAKLKFTLNDNFQCDKVYTTEARYSLKIQDNVTLKSVTNISNETATMLVDSTVSFFDPTTPLLFLLKVSH